MATLTIPAGVVTDDLMFIAVSYKNNTTAATINTPSGWSVLGAVTNGPNAIGQQGAVFMKTATGTDAGSTLTVNTTVASQQINVAFAAYSGATGVRSSSWVAGSATAATAVTCPAPGTAPLGGDLVVLVGAARESTSGPASSPTFTAPSGATIRAQSAGTSGSAQNVASFIGDHDNTAGDRTVTPSVTAWAVAGQVVLQGSSQSLTAATAETLTSADVAAGNVVLPRGQGETMTLGGAAGGNVALGRAQPESVTQADTWARAVAGLAAIANSLGLVDAPTRGALAYARATAETLTSADSAAALRSLGRADAESATLGNAVAAVSVRARGSAETLQQLDVPTRLVARPRAQPESLTQADGFGRTTARASSTGEALTLGNAVARGQGTGIAVAGALTSSDAWSYTVIRAIAAAAALTLVDGSARAAGLVRAQPEGLTVGNTIGTGMGVNLGTAETVTVGNAFIRAAGNSRTVGNSVTFDDRPVPGVVKGRGVAETLTQAADIQVGRVVLVAVSETLTQAGVFARAETGGAVTTEALALVNVLGRQVDRARPVTQTLTVADGWQAGRVVLAATAEGVQLVDALVRSATGYGRAGAEALAIANTISRGSVAKARGTAEASTFADDWLASRQIVPAAAVTEVAFSDTTQATAARSRAATQSITSSDASSRRIDRARAQPELLTMAGLFQPIRGQGTGTVDGFTLDDLFRLSSSHAVAAIEAVLLFSAAGAGGEDGPILIAHSSRARMTKGSYARVRMTKGG